MDGCDYLREEIDNELEDEVVATPYQQLIGDRERELSIQLRKDLPKYGAEGKKWAPGVRTIIKRVAIKDVLDYGCGMGMLSREIPLIPWYNYDPTVEGMLQEPISADLVVCTHVLEHVQAELLEAVLAEIVYHARKCVLFSLKAGLSGKILADGRDSNLNLQSIEDWFFDISDAFPADWNAIVVNRRAFILKGLIRPRDINPDELTLIMVKKEYYTNGIPDTI